MDHVFGTKELFTRLCAHLITQGVQEVSVDFDGSGDSGSLGDITLEFVPDCDNKRDHVLKTQIEGLKASSTFDHATNRWVYRNTPCVMTVEELLKQATDAALEQSNLDWYNNDGGYGTLTLKLRNEAGEPELVLDMHIRETRTDDHTFDCTAGFEEVVPTDEG